MSSGVAGLKFGSVIAAQSSRKLRQKAIRPDDRLQHRVRDNNLRLAGGVWADLIRIESDLQSHRRDVPTVKVLNLRPGEHEVVVPYSVLKPIIRPDGLLAQFAR